jgi:dTDP-glucose 4,6-dehydratase
MENLQHKSILVTGGLGFMGRDFVNLMSQSYPEAQITIFDKSIVTESETRWLPQGVTLVRGHLEDSKDLPDLISSSDAVVNFAAETHNDTSLLDPDSFFDSNIRGTYRLLRLLQGSKTRYHQVSTDEVFGDLPLDSEKTFDDESPIRPSSPYSSSKACGDILTLAWIRSFGLQATISNSCNNFGPHQNPEKLIPNIINRVSKGEKPQLYGNGRNVREWIHVHDHSRAIQKILETGVIGTRYLIGSGVHRSNLQVLEAVLVALGKPLDFFEFVQDRAGHDLKYAVNTSNLLRDTNWVPSRLDFEAEISELARQLTK